MGKMKKKKKSKAYKVRGMEIDRESDREIDIPTDK